MNNAPVSRETLERRLDAFRAEFARWSRHMNLTSASERGNLNERHIHDSLQLLDLAPSARTWVDVGTGGGFPGAILTAALPDDTVSMVESNAKKAAFLRAACLAMGVRADVRDARAETVVASTPAPDVVSARAVAPLPDLLNMLAPWLVAGTLGLFPKGRTAEDEVAAARERHRFEVERHPSRTAEDAMVLAIQMGRE